MKSSKPRVVAVVQARLGSSRLPGKVLKELGSRTVIDHLLWRLKRCVNVDEVVVATSDLPGDDELDLHLRRVGARCYRGPEQDVLARFAGAATAHNAEVVVRLTGDCPLLDADEVDRVVGVFLERWDSDQPTEFVRNQAGSERKIPHGLDVEVMTASVLLRAAQEATRPGEREHVTPWMYADGSDVSQWVSHPPGQDLSALRLTVDTPQDLAALTEVVTALGDDVSGPAACRWLLAHPEVRALQEGVSQRGVLDAQTLRRERVQGRLLVARVDAGQQIGFGHLARVEAIMTAWTALGGVAAVHGAGLTGPVAERMGRQGVELHHLPRPAASPGLGGPDDVGEAPEEDALRTVELARSRHAVAVLVDGYPFRTRWQKTVASQLPLVAIDDMAQFAQMADVVVNQNVGFEPGRYRWASDGGGSLLCGAPFVLLRPEFRAPRVPASLSPKRVIVTFGGADLGGWTVPVVREALSELPSTVRVEALVGSATPAEVVQTLRDLRLGQDRLRILEGLTEVAPWMDGAELALCAAGSTCWELLSRGVVPVTVPLAENQKAVSRGLARHGAGWVSEGACTPRELVTAAGRLLNAPQQLEQMRRAGAGLIDGRGVWRVIDATLDAAERRRARRT